ncbi:hypothetical protein EV126DRAFT_414407, partial [Verticillium dahliae]
MRCQARRSFRGHRCRYRGSRTTGSMLGARLPSRAGELRAKVRVQQLRTAGQDRRGRMWCLWVAICVGDVAKIGEKGRCTTNARLPESSVLEERWCPSSRLLSRIVVQYPKPRWGPDLAGYDLRCGIRGEPGEARGSIAAAGYYELAMVSRKGLEGGSRGGNRRRGEESFLSGKHLGCVYFRVGRCMGEGGEGPSL